MAPDGTNPLTAMAQDNGEARGAMPRRWLFPLRMIARPTMDGSRRSAAASSDD
jgi:hypothetical protein